MFISRVRSLIRRVAAGPRVALVTGGSHGIGRATAASATPSRRPATPWSAFTVQNELGTQDDAARFWGAFDAAGQEYVPDGRLDILVHNAAQGSSARLADLSEEEFDQVIAVNVKAPLAGSSPSPASRPP